MKLLYYMSEYSFSCLFILAAKVAMQVVEYLKNAMKSLWPGKSTDAVVNEIVGSRKLKVGRQFTFIIITIIHHSFTFIMIVTTHFGCCWLTVNKKKYCNVRGR